MQLWKKNYFLTFLIFQTLIFIGIFIFSLTSFKQQLKSEFTLFRQIINTSDFFVSKIESENEKESVFDYIIDGQESLSFFLEVKKNDKVIAGSIPKNYVIKEELTNEVINLEKEKKKPFLVLEKELVVKETNYQVTYLKDISEVYKAQTKQNIMLYLAGLFFTAIIGLVIYWRMKKIYRPIQNIAHELRTPLTLIKGYSELLLRVKVDEEKKMEISSQIMTESQKLQATVEQLLLMGDLKEGEIGKKLILLSEVLLEYQEMYPELQVELKGEEPILANQVLIGRLLDNLLSNAYKASEKVLVTINQKTLIIENDEASIPKETLKKINKGKKLLPYEYSGTGQGLVICREIVQLHEGKFEISSDERKVKVKIDFI